MDCIVSDEFHANYDITCNELLQIWEERLVLVLTVELLSSVAVEARHLQFVDSESIVLDAVDDLAHLSVAVGFDHGECTLASSFKMLASVNIAVVHDFDHTRENVYLSSNEEVIEDNRWDLLFFEEDAVLQSVVHFN